MELNEILTELEALGSPSIKKVLMNQGAPDPIWGVKIGDMKPLLKKIKNDQVLALKLYETGISDAMYLAGLAADGAKMDKETLQHWVELASWEMISEYTVPWVAAENPNALELALEWIESDKESIASSGWCLLSGLATLKKDEDMDIALYSSLLKRVEDNISQAKNRVKYCMNSFVIATGAGISSLTEEAMQIARKNGKIEVMTGKTACKVPFAPDYLQKIIDMGRIGFKKKTLKC